MRRLDRRSPLMLGLSAVAVVAVAVPLALARHGSAAATVRVAPLTAADRAALIASRPMVEALPSALSQVPVAASDASGQQVSPAQARQLLGRTPALSALSHALADPTAVTGPLTSAYLAVLDRKQPPAPDALPQALENLQNIEAQIEPAIRLVAAHHGGTPPSAAATLAAIEGDQRVRSLAGLVAGWPQIYGAFTLVEQACA